MTFKQTWKDTISNRILFGDEIDSDLTYFKQWAKLLLHLFLFF
jgi:hypothetical protein